MSCGCAAPLVRLRISSAKPKDSATGSTDWIVKKGDTAPAAGEHVIDAAEDLGGGLDLDAVHGQHQARGPVEHTGAQGGGEGLDDLAREAGEAVARRRGRGLVLGGVNDDVLDENGDALHGLVAEGALGRGELEGVGDLVGDVDGAEDLVGLRRGGAFALGGRGEELREEALLGRVDEEVGPRAAGAEGGDAVDGGLEVLAAAAGGLEGGLEVALEVVEGHDLGGRGGTVRVHALDDVAVLEEEVGDVGGQWADLEADGDLLGGRGADDDTAAEFLVGRRPHLLGADDGLAVGDDGGAGLDVAAGEALLDVCQATLEVQLAGGQEDVLAAAELLVLGAGVRLDEQLQAVDHLVEIGRVDGLEGDTDDGLAEVGDAREVDGALEPAAQGAVLEEVALEAADAEDDARGNRLKGLEVAAHEHVECGDGDLLRLRAGVGVRGGPLGRDDPEGVADREGAGVHAREADEVLGVDLLFFVFGGVVIQVDLLEGRCKVVDAVGAGRRRGLGASSLRPLLPCKLSRLVGRQLAGLASLSGTETILLTYATTGSDRDVLKDTMASLIFSSTESAPGTCSSISGSLSACAAGGDGRDSMTETSIAVDSGSQDEKTVVRSSRGSLERMM
ncbi:uncharacterized protein ColSpa_07008 [Colletotrichum spaethianum]|uniref:Uncharacterized protein n=1 Tax=Colletotrichum spaethianum TaxID=700344 RepID=A0AA37LE95_9PEZI|nr:uncharacterized protein ColSpa_07008 [Colletotrichum spaethianum]GKT46828.1 hypothetical protein ColSpa_07008 [Colletotrichum spaethianum]